MVRCLSPRGTSRDGVRPPPPAFTHLSTTGNVTQGEMKMFQLQMPAGKKVVIRTTSTADVDLYVQFGAAPTTGAYLNRGYTSSGNETISFTATSNGTFQFSRPDFSFAQVRSNLVVRWEYRPGSTVFAIWSHGQTATGGDGRFDLGRDLDNLGGTQGEDIVMVKVNYWIGL